MDSPTPAGYVADAEEALGKARAMRDAAAADVCMWNARIGELAGYRDAIRAWAKKGGTGPRPRKPQEPDCS